MINTEESLQSINNLIGEKFNIPNYQRGYRWGESQVEELLNDIWDFLKIGQKMKYIAFNQLSLKTTIIFGN